jgi:hypothetical protein
MLVEDLTVGAGWRSACPATAPGEFFLPATGDAALVFGARPRCGPNFSPWWTKPSIGSKISPGPAGLTAWHEHRMEASRLETASFGTASLLYRGLDTGKVDCRSGRRANICCGHQARQGRFGERHRLVDG